MYRNINAVLIRAAAYPDGTVLPPRPEPSGDARADAESWRRWIEAAWALRPVAEAVELASPTLAHRLRRVCAGDAHEPGQFRRAAVSLARYVLRLRYRCTPFGLFAGIAPATVGARLDVRWGDAHRPVARVDATWLADVVRHLEACPELLSRLPVAVDSTAFVRGDRLVIPCQQPAHDDPRAPGEVTVRRTGALRTVVTAAATPVPAGDLADKLAADYPESSRSDIDAFIAELVGRRILLTALHPPMTVTDPLGHVLDRLSTARADTIAATAPTVRALRGIYTALRNHTHAPPETRRRLRASAVEKMMALSGGVEQPLSVDLRVDCSLTLPYAVAREAEKAAEALVRLTPFPTGSPAWADYHTRFLERYGVGAVVPVLDVIDPDTGLDLPAGYRGSLLPRPVPGLTSRDEKLFALAQSAASGGSRELVLTEELMGRLGHGRNATPLPHIDLRFRLQARTRDAVESGDFTLVVTGLTPSTGATAGRFLGLLDGAERERFTDAYGNVPTLDGGAVRAQVSSPPLHVRAANVGRAPALWPRVMSLAEHPAGPTTPLDDVAVTADATRMRLISRSTGRPIEPMVMSAVDLGAFTHPLARFLCELPRARAAAFGPFTWGAASRLPYLPRVRHGRTLLAPATWRITADDIAPPDASETEWRAALTAWQERFRLPALVEAGDDDRCLRLDLNHGGDTALLRAELNHAGHATLREAPEATAYGWFDARPHDITVGLASTLPARARKPSEAPAVTARRDHGQLPGSSSCAYFKAYGHPDRVQEVLTTHLPRLWDTWDTPPDWWFVRYRDPQPHLRVRIRLSRPNAFGAVAERVGAWAADLQRSGLLGHTQWDTYYPETGRYGTGAAMAAAESFFAADSAAALAEIALAVNGHGRPRAVTAASLLDLAVSCTGSVPTGTRWLIDHVNPSTAPHPDRPLHQEAVRLANPCGGLAALRSLPGGAEVATAWEGRRTALRRYRARLADDGTPPEAVLPSLLHVHVLRVAGADAAGEQTCQRLARSAALAWSARSGGVPR